jgi:hypothetical protein
MNEHGTVKMTEKLHRDVLEEPIGSEAHVLEPSELEEEMFGQTIDLDITKARQQKPERSKIKKAKVGIKRQGKVEFVPISTLQNELRKHSDARKKTDLAVKDIEKLLKDLLLAHHSAIKDLQKQVNNMHRKISTIESRKSRSKITAKKVKDNKKTKSKSSRKNKGRKTRSYRQ